MTLGAVLWVVLVGLTTIATAVWIVALVDCAYRRYSHTREKLVWLLVTLLGHWLGAVVYWFVGRNRGTLGTA